MDDADPEEPSATTPALPDDLIVEEILVRLPPKVVLRFRAVCRAWRSDTSTPMFLRSNYDHQVPLPLVFFSNCTKDPDTLDTIDVLAAEYRRTLLAFGCGTLHASCEGLLLISHENARYTIYNPATQQGLSLRELTSARYALLYSSRSSDGGVECRILFCKGRPAMYHVLTVGSSAPPRRIHLPQGPKDFTKLMATGYPSFQSPSIQFNGALHWLMGKSLVVFDKVVESFRSMRCPSALLDARLFEIDGTFGMSVRGARDTAVSVWVLQDYQAEAWTLRYSIDLAMVDRLRVKYDSRHMLLSNDGHLLVSSGAGSTTLILCDAQGTLIKDFSVNSWNPKVTGLSYKESIVRHSFFESKGKRRRPQASLFKRLRKGNPNFLLHTYPYDLGARFSTISHAVGFGRNCFILVLSILELWSRNDILRDAISFPYISIYLKLQKSGN